MNEYLINLGEKLKTIRKALNWTQEDLANKIGVSRVTIVNLEKDPTNMSKSTAFSLYVVIYNELIKRKKELKNIDFSLLNNKKKKSVLSNQLKELGLTSTVIKSALVFPFLGALGVAAANLTNILSNSKNKSKNQDEKISEEKIKEVAYASFEIIEEKINESFELEDISDIQSFVNKVENK